MTDAGTWLFEPRGIMGEDVVHDNSSSYFRDDPIVKLVREILQNSLDAQDLSLNAPVHVLLEEIQIDASHIGATELESHLQACFGRTVDEKREKLQRLYRSALETIRAPQIRCLKAIDSGTLGLKGPAWNSLVFQQGAVEKPGDAPGGSNGAGKNAALTVSDIRTVFYSTRYVHAKEGRVERLQGKATLMTHPNPSNSDESLQHVGFYASPSGKPLTTTEIPDVFRLPEVGTGVFIIGFNPRSTSWVQEVVTAVIDNFFFAIHNKRLTVTVRDTSMDSIEVTHETLDSLFANTTGEVSQASRHFYTTIRDTIPAQTEPIGKLGPLHVYVHVGAGPNRTAYINRNGMLISNSRDQKVNPLAPRRQPLWPDYSVVITPTTDQGDEWIRQTENLSHDSMSLLTAFAGKELRQAENWFQQTRRAIIEIVDREARVQEYGDTSNLDELASYFPDELDPNLPGNTALRTRIVPTRIPARAPVVQEEGDTRGTEDGEKDGTGSGTEAGEGEGESSGGTGQGGQGGGRRGQGDSTTQGGGRRPRIDRPRMIPTGPNSAAIAFTPAIQQNQTLTIRLLPIGAERSQEAAFEVTSVQVEQPANRSASVLDGKIVVDAHPDERLHFTVVTRERLPGFAFRIG